MYILVYINTHVRKPDFIQKKHWRLNVPFFRHARPVQKWKLDYKQKGEKESAIIAETHQTVNVEQRK